jgi:uncharacterized protein
MKFVLAITQKCNLACDYCYIGKKQSVMPLSTAESIIDFIFQYAQKNGVSERIDISFFGGEPLIEIELLKKITRIIKNHRSYNKFLVLISLVSNGTLLSEDILKFLKENNIELCISCDGPAEVQDKFRHFPDGRGSSSVVEKNIKRAVKIFPLLSVNAVFSPENLYLLPEAVDYLASLGVRNIDLNPNIYARWTKDEADMLPEIFDRLGKRYVKFYQQGEPRFISLIDSKIAVILREGYRPLEKCRMGNGEFAFGPSGNIYPCEKFIGSDDGIEHCIGSIKEGFTAGACCKGISNVVLNEECLTCGLNEYCMNWCGCTNYYSTGNYNLVSPFMCAFEKALVNTAFKIIQNLDYKLLNFSDHLAGMPLMNVIGVVYKEELKNSSSGK